MGQWVSSLNSRMFFEGNKTMDMTFFGTPEHLGLESRIVGQVADISVTRLIFFNKNCYLATKDGDKFVRETPCDVKREMRRIIKFGAELFSEKSRCSQDF